MNDTMENYLTHFKVVAFDQTMAAMRASTAEELKDVLTEIQTLMKIIKPMGRDNIDFNMLYNEMLLVHLFVSEKLSRCAD